MKTLVGLCLAAAAWLAGCAHEPPLPPAADLFHDELFQRPARPVDPAAALVPSTAMLQYLKTRLDTRVPGADKRRRLLDALYHGDLRLEYDASSTRTAAEAFDARSGNCMALVLMTAAFAKELGLVVHYQSVLGEAAWNRSDELYIEIGHVNLQLEERRDTPGLVTTAGNTLTVDFLPPRDAATLVTEPITEARLLAMYANNRAVETLSEGHRDTAYWWSRAAIESDPQLDAPYVTLAVVYRQQHRPDLAETVLARLAARTPDDMNVMSNRVLALRDLGRTADAEKLAARLAELDPHPPFSYFHEGQAALRAGRPDVARRLFAKEVARAPYHDEFQYWLAVSEIEMHDATAALAHLKRAMEVSTTRKDHDLYAAKLERLQALHAQ